MLARHLYVHVPFCARRCSYCDFAIAVRRFVPVDDFVRGIAREVALRVPGPAPTLDTVYLGGGTPSRLGAEGIARLIQVLSERVELAPGAEVTMEANPEDVTERRVSAWRAAGINRLSIGAQSFDQRVLAWMHRTHDVNAIGCAVNCARDGGITNISLDLIFSVPAELQRDWTLDIESALALEPQHLSLYGLTVEPGTPLARWRARGEAREAPEESFEEEFLAAHNRLVAAGYEHYEVSNYSRPGERSRHNSAYWTRAPYLGLGPSAHSFDGSARWWNVAAYAEWQRRVDLPGDPMTEREVLTEEQSEAERTYLGLRTTNGIELPLGTLPLAERWVEEGWAAIADGRISLTPLGWLRLDALAAALTPVASRS
ncbi:MAG TPA: radical SAM family heme chaperone HemW [Gemmatimonadaceae bacterium]|nr:radical SAM family heme chaperone HemW [Gemmatimonadaceae bacterium]